MMDTYQNICDGFVGTHCQGTGTYDFLGIANVTIIVTNETGIKVGLHLLLLIIDPIPPTVREALNGIS